VLFEETAASQKTARLLGIAPNSPVIHIRRELMTFAVGAVRETKELVDGFDELFLPKDIFPTLSADMFSEDIRSLYGFYQRRCGVTVTRVEDMAKAALVNPEQAAAAGVSMPYPAIRLHRVSYAVNDHAVELRYLTTITERCHFVFN
ncbi:UTRA domain-containing protein, partial [Sutterella wadsworthensis]